MWRVRLAFMWKRGQHNCHHIRVQCICDGVCEAMASTAHSQKALVYQLGRNPFPNGRLGISRLLNLQRKSVVKIDVNSNQKQLFLNTLVRRYIYDLHLRRVINVELIHCLIWRSVTGVHTDFGVSRDLFSLEREHAIDSDFNIFQPGIVVEQIPSHIFEGFFYSYFLSSSENIESNSMSIKWW